jgi:hypothetical protein
MCYYADTGNKPTEKGGNTMPTEKEIKRIELATIYELRLLLADQGKDNFTAEELNELLDNYAKTKNTPV